MKMTAFKNQITRWLPFLSPSCFCGEVGSLEGSTFFWILLLVHLVIHCKIIKINDILSRCEKNLKETKLHVSLLSKGVSVSEGR